MRILKDISELIDAKIISEDTANRIRDYYLGKKESSQSRLFIVFGLFGAMLVGLGFILIVAHNWDELSRATKTAFAFLPLVLGQATAGYSLIKKKDSYVWKESASAFLVFAVGSSIFLVSQIYNIPGNVSTFMLTWTLLCVPLVYIMRSSITSLLYLIGITYYACETGYFNPNTSDPTLYWLLLLLVLPHYYILVKTKPESNFMIFHNWFIPLSIFISLGTLANTAEEIMFIAYFSLFGLFYSIGNMDFFLRQKTRSNSYLAIGSLGTVTLLLILSFDWFWKELRNRTYEFETLIISQEFFVSLGLTLMALGMLYIQWKKKSAVGFKPIEFVFLLFIVTYILGFFSPVSVIIINVTVFIVGIMTIREGARQDHLGILNYGLFIITTLIICRFFDTELSFVLRGILFVCVGIGFFATNYWMLKKRKTHE